jgi:chitodextrinase
MTRNPLKDGNISENSAGIGTVARQTVRGCAEELAMINGSWLHRRAPNAYSMKTGLHGMDFVKAVWGMAIALGLAPLVLPTVVLGSATPAFVQERDSQITSGRTVQVAFRSSTTAGNLIVAYVVWDNTGSVSLADSAGNSYVSAVGPTRWSGSRYSSQIFYAKNIKGGADTLTGSFASRIRSFGTVYVHEYSGLDPTAPLDMKAAATGASGSLNSGSAATANAVELLFAAGVSAGTVGPPGAGYTARATPHGDMTMDKVVSAQGTYNATAGNSGGAWAMQMVAFKAAMGTLDPTAPTVPAGLAATAISSSQVNLSWTASTDVDNASGQLRYGIYRNNIRIATTTAGTTQWNDAGLAAATTYAYAVNAQDPAGNSSAQSPSVNATTLPPALPVIGSFSKNPASIIAGQTSTLSWVVANATSLTVNQGVGTVTGGTAALVRPTTTTVYTLTASNNIGSTTAQTTVTVSPDTIAPTVPVNLAAAAVSASQINLAWTASTDNVAVTRYQIYRNGAGVGTTTAATYSNSGLSANTNYTYSVAAFDAAGNLSVPSAGVSATTLALPLGDYTTTFPLTENPISENGSWINGGTVGLDWGNIKTTSGHAWPTSMPSQYGDPTAVLAGTWGPTQMISAVVDLVNRPTGGDAEVELRLRSSITSHSCSGYEFLYSVYGSYAQIVRWNGPLGSYNYLNQNMPNPGALITGDVLTATITNSTMYFFKNGNLLGTATDSTFSGGSPGIGFYPNQVSTLNWGFSSFSATSK